MLAPTAEHAREPLGAVLARSTTSGDYVATTVVDLQGAAPGTLAGLAAFGDPANALGLTIGGGKARLWVREKNQQKTVAESDWLKPLRVHLRMTASSGNRFSFALGADGKAWQSLGQDAEGGFLPPWDRSIRVALTAGGAEGAAARFDYLHVTPTGVRQAGGR